MKSIFDKEAKKEIFQRIDQLTEPSTQQWGKMNVAQMMAHCTIALEMATGEQNPKRMFLGRIIGPFVKSTYYNEKPFAKNSPTNKDFVINDKRNFKTEKKLLKAKINQFSEGGKTKCTTHPHPFFGSYTPEQWSIGMYKHLDHHLRQFNV